MSPKTAAIVRSDTGQIAVDLSRFYGRCLIPTDHSYPAGAGFPVGVARSFYAILCHNISTGIYRHRCLVTQFASQHLDWRKPTDGVGDGHQISCVDRRAPQSLLLAPAFGADWRKRNGKNLRWRSIMGLVRPGAGEITQYARADRSLASPVAHTTDPP